MKGTNVKQGEELPVGVITLHQSFATLELEADHVVGLRKLEVSKLESTHIVPA